MDNNNSRIVRKQFGSAAKKYVDSNIHANDYTLKRLIELVVPESKWIVLDIATGGGHTARVFSEQTAKIVALDITLEMLQAAATYNNHLRNIIYDCGDAQHLPFQSEAFDLVTCRLAAHHFPNVFRFVAEAYRVLKWGGKLAIVDSHLPDTKGGDYINKIQKLHDPSHVRCISYNEWQNKVLKAGFKDIVIEEGYVELDFLDWASRMSVSVETQQDLMEMILNAPSEAMKILKPEIKEGRLQFCFQRIIIVVKK